jgi:hypothetical protein
MRYVDKHGTVIVAGMTLKHDDGERAKVYETDDDDLGFNASNEDWVGFTESGRQLYPLYQFNLTDWEVVYEALDA